MGNANSSQRPSRTDFDATWSHSYPRNARTWAQQNGNANGDRYRPYSPAGNKSQLSDPILPPKSLPADNGEQQYIASEATVDHLARYNR